MAQSQAMMRDNPEMMQQMMQSPMVQQMMENPEIARLLEDPETLRQSARLMANPSLMREMQRQQDTAMGRLDVMPGGHQALARMHREVLDPLHSSMTGGTGDGNNGVNTYTEDAQGHRNTAPLANPWGAPQPASQPATPAVTSTPFPAAPAPAPAPFPAAPAPGGYAEAAAPANPMQQPMTPFGANPFGGPGMMNSPMMQQMM